MDPPSCFCLGQSLLDRLSVCLLDSKAGSRVDLQVGEKVRADLLFNSAGPNLAYVLWLEYEGILGLNGQNLNETAVAANGYRQSGDDWNKLTNIRKQDEDMIFKL